MNERLTWGPLHEAAYDGLLAEAERLLCADADLVHALLEDVGQTPLHMACKRGHTDMARLLLKAGACVNARDHNYAIPLHFASNMGFVDTVQLLISRGGHVCAKNQFEETPIYMAVFGSFSRELHPDADHMAVVETLLAHGACPHYCLLDDYTDPPHLVQRLNLAISRGLEQAHANDVRHKHHCKRHAAEAGAEEEKDSEVTAVAGKRAVCAGHKQQPSTASPSPSPNPSLDANATPHTRNRSKHVASPPPADTHVDSAVESVRSQHQSLLEVRHTMQQWEDATTMFERFSVPVLRANECVAQLHDSIQDKPNLTTRDFSKLESQHDRFRRQLAAQLEQLRRAGCGVMRAVLTGHDKHVRDAVAHRNKQRNGVLTLAGDIRQAEQGHLAWQERAKSLEKRALAALKHVPAASDSPSVSSNYLTTASSFSSPFTPSQNVRQAFHNLNTINTLEPTSGGDSDTPHSASLGLSHSAPQRLRIRTNSTASARSSPTSPLSPSVVLPAHFQFQQPVSPRMQQACVSSTSMAEVMAFTEEQLTPALDSLQRHTTTGAQQAGCLQQSLLEQIVLYDTINHACDTLCSEQKVFEKLALLLQHVRELIRGMSDDRWSPVSRFHTHLDAVVASLQRFDAVSLDCEKRKLDKAIKLCNQTRKRVPSCHDALDSQHMQLHEEYHQDQEQRLETHAKAKRAREDLEQRLLVLCEHGSHELLSLLPRRSYGLCVKRSVDIDYVAVPHTQHYRLRGKNDVLCMLKRITTADWRHMAGRGGVELVRQVRHPNVLAPDTVFRDSDDPNAYFVHTPLFPDGNLSTLVAWHESRGICKPDPRTIFREIAQGLAFLHSHGVVHGRLKCENVIITTDDVFAGFAWCPKLMDFGYSQDGPQCWRYAAPECIPPTATPHSSLLSPTPASDMFAFGLLLKEYALGREVPHVCCGEDNVTPLDVLVARQPFLDHSRDCDVALLQLLRALTDADPATRPTAIEVLAHPYLRAAFLPLLPPPIAAGPPAGCVCVSPMSKEFHDVRDGFLRGSCLTARIHRIERVTVSPELQHRFDETRLMMTKAKVHESMFHPATPHDKHIAHILDHGFDWNHEGMLGPREVAYGNHFFSDPSTPHAFALHLAEHYNQPSPGMHIRIFVCKVLINRQGRWAAVKKSSHKSRDKPAQRTPPIGAWEMVESLRDRGPRHSPSSTQRRVLAMSSDVQSVVLGPSSSPLHLVTPSCPVSCHAIPTHVITYSTPC